jgi:predicted metal-binding transcription factor (methanogenesis marker protein 9)
MPDAPPATTRRDPSINGRGEKRKSQPTNAVPVMGAGIGIVPRRVLPSGINSHDALCDPEKVQWLGVNGAFRLFEILLDLHPSLKQAKSNALRLVFGEGKTKFVAFTEGVSGDGKDVRDEELTSEIEDLFKSQPDEIGGLVGLQTALAISGMISGMGCLEAVPGPRGSGIRRFWIVDTLTIGLARPGNDPDADLAAYQKQTNLTGAAIANGGWVQMPAETFKWSAIDGTPSNPYGVGLFSAAFNQALADFQMNKNLRDAVHNAAWPRLDYEYDVERITNRGVVSLKKDFENVSEEDNLTDLDRYVNTEIDRVVADVVNMPSDGNPVHSSDLKINPIPAGDFTGLAEPLQMERHRLVQSLDELPTLMGINDGSTQTYTSVEWGIRATKAEWLRDWVNVQIAWGLELHFRLKGKVATVRAECEAVRSSDAKSDAETKEIVVRTEAAVTNRGLQELSEEAQNVTNSGLPTSKEAKARQAKAQEGVTDPKAGGTQESSSAGDSSSAPTMDENKGDKSN